MRRDPNVLPIPVAATACLVRPEEIRRAADRGLLVWAGYERAAIVADDRFAAYKHRHRREVPRRYKPPSHAAPMR